MDRLLRARVLVVEAEDPGRIARRSAVRDALQPSFGELAWTVPVLIDVGIAVFSGIDLLFTRLDMRLRWLRLVPWTLNGATIWPNVADEKTSVGIVAHASAPILWIVTVELAGHFLRARSGMEANPARRRAAGRMDRVPSTRWLMAPWSTLVIRRWMIMQEERSFDRAYARWWAPQGGPMGAPGHLRPSHADRRSDPQAVAGRTGSRCSACTGA